MISVCMATFDGAQYIKEQVESILSQLNENDELVISDDGSTDGTLDILAAMSDPRVKIFANKFRPSSVKNTFFYTTKNFEYALRQCKGDLIFLADQDDLWHKDKVRVCKEVLVSYDLILHDCSIVDQNGRMLEPSYFRKIGSRPGIMRNMVKNAYLGCCMAFRRQVLDDVLPFPKVEVPHDIWIGLIIELKGKVKFLDKSLVSYRRHGLNLSNAAEKSNNSLLFKLIYRMNLAAALFRRLVL